MPFCSNCGKEAPSEASFCPFCGSSLIIASITPPLEIKTPKRAAELSWGKTFSYAVRYIIYAILWIIIGGLTMGIGISIIASAPFKFGPGMLTGIVIIIIGYVIMFLGIMAAYFKVMSRLIYESIYKSAS